jgi:hypothetical protein
MRKHVLTTAAAALLFVSADGLAALSAQEAARLGTDLTPTGAIQAGNAEGTIPPWDGGIKSPPGPSYTPGDHHPDPYPDDPILFTITRENMAQYADKLTAGHKALLETYDSFSMNVYPTRRSFAAPQRIYDAIKANATTAELVDGGDGVRNAIIGLPFPIPSNGVEAVWNHILRWRADQVKRPFGQAPVTRGGDYTMVEFQEDAVFRYGWEGMTEAKLDNVIVMFRQQILGPARLAGRILLVHETLDQAKEHRKAWIYNPGQRRVRRAPNVAFDNPKEGGDGLATSDQLDMFNGSPQQYNWELLGRKEIYVPYNSYKLHSDELKYTDIIKPLHMNPEYPRYELHRVWVVDGLLKEGVRNIYKRRTFYIDEDSWQIVAVDQYDNRDQMWRVSEGHGINYYEVPNYWTTVEVHYDLQSGRYLAIGLNNEVGMFDFGVQYDESDFSTGTLRRLGRR